MSIEAARKKLRLRKKMKHAGVVSTMKKHRTCFVPSARESFAISVFVKSIVHTAA